jgi:uncharacterized protein YdeI (YjbR/CyaY-like superfamily)
MGRKDERITAYIAGAPEFARPILKHLRAVVHEACPQVEETLKWKMPSFEYKGLLCGMAAFKQHATFGFWKGRLIVDTNGRKGEEAMGQFGCLTSVRDLPAKRVLVGYVRKAMALNENGITVKRVTKSKSPLATPQDLKTALARSRRASANWDELPPGAKRDYLEWVLEAKQAATRARRIATTVEWVAAGKKRNWKYEKC